MNPKRQVVLATKLYVVSPNICAPPVPTLLYVKHLTSTILKWLLYFKKLCTPGVEICGYTTQSKGSILFSLLHPSE